MNVLGACYHMGHTQRFWHLQDAGLTCGVPAIDTGGRESGNRFDSWWRAATMLDTELSETCV